MKLHDPFLITSRLLPGVKVGETTISIEITGETSQGRTKYRWYIDSADLEVSGDDLKSGCQGGDIQSGMESLLSFLSAAGESYHYWMGKSFNEDGTIPENLDLFSPEVNEWAYRHSDELSMLQCELEENKNLIED